MFVAVFLGYHKYWLRGFMIFVVLTEGSTSSGSCFKASQKTGLQLKVSFDRLQKAWNKTSESWFTRHGLIPTQRLKADVPSALSLGRLFLQITSQISETLMRYAK